MYIMVQVQIVDGLKWIQSANGSSTLDTLTDVSISSPLHDKVLIYTTASSLNKWTPYTISGATFKDTNKTFTISAGSSALSRLTDVSVSSPSNDQVLIYTTAS